MVTSNIITSLNNYYPPCARPALVFGLSSHSDGSAMIVLQKDTACVGLQVLKDDLWVPVKPLHHALVINIGDTFEVPTNEKYKSVEHRAVTNLDMERLSIVTFYAPSYNVLLGPLPSLLRRRNPAGIIDTIMESTAATMLPIGFKERIPLNLDLCSAPRLVNAEADFGPNL